MMRWHNLFPAEFIDTIWNIVQYATLNLISLAFWKWFHVKATLVLCLRHKRALMMFAWVHARAITWMQRTQTVVVIAGIASQNTTDFGTFTNQFYKVIRKKNDAKYSRIAMCCLCLIFIQMKCQSQSTIEHHKNRFINISFEWRIWASLLCKHCNNHTR